MARFGQALKPSKAPQQLSKALDVQNLPQQLSKASRLLCHGNFLGPTSCFYWASPLLRGTFWPPLQIIKTFAAAFEGLRTSKPPQQLSQASRLLGHGTSVGPTSCFYWASKLLRGTFWAGLKTLKSPAAAFEGLTSSTPSAAAFEGVPLAWPWYLRRPHKLFYWASKLLYVARFGQALKPSKAPQQLSKALEVQNLPQQLLQASRLLGHGTSVGPTSCFYWASKLLRGTFWAGLKTFKSSAAAFEGLRSSKPSAAAFAGIPLAWPWYLRRPHKLFLLGFETATWHVLGRP